MASLPDLNIPSSKSTVNVSIIHTGTRLTAMLTNILVTPAIPGYEHLNAPAYSFLIQHPTQDRTLVFDLGCRKDPGNFPAATTEQIVACNIELRVPKDIREMLDEHGVDTKKIEAVIWSHYHFDHIGNPSTFEPSTKIVVGQGTKDAVFPGYPAKADACFHESEAAGRQVDEVDFSTSSLKIAGFPAVDYFGDGSFFLLYTPGHCIGHMCGLARVTSNPDSFIFLGGDTFHHGGEMRPNPYRPMPASILPNPFDPESRTPCPGEIFDKWLPGGRQAPFLKPRPALGGFHFDPPTAVETIKNLSKVDAHDNIFMVVAHDVSLLNVVDFFPKTANAFMEKGWGPKTRWAWLADFAKAVGLDENIPRALFGDPRPDAEKM